MSKLKTKLVEKWPPIGVIERQYKPGFFSICGESVDLDEDQACSIVRAYRYLVERANNGDTEAEKILEGEKV